MATRKTTPAAAAAAKTPARTTAAPATSSPVRNSPIPKPVAAAPAPARREITHEMIAVRAFEIYASGTGGSEFDNWARAERELRGV